MRTITTFAALMAAGVLIVLIYLWSGESLIALVASLAALVAGALLIDRLQDSEDGSAGGADGGLGLMWSTARRRLAPMFGDTDNDNTDNTDNDNTDKYDDGTGPSPSPAPPPPLGRSERGPAWRSRFDVTLSEQGLTGVAIGSDAPQMWRWDHIDEIGHELCRATDAEGSVAERTAIRLDLPDDQNPAESIAVMVMLGPEQHLADVVARARSAWRADKQARPRLGNLPALERTRLLAEHLGGTDIVATVPTTQDQTAESFHRQARQALLAEGWLYRLGPARSFDEVLDAYEGLLEASGLEPIDQQEFDDFTAANDARTEDGQALHRALDAAAEQRGFRIVYLDEGAGELTMGLVPDDAIDEWDGQTVGNGTVRVVSEPPVNPPSSRRRRP